MQVGGFAGDQQYDQVEMDKFYFSDKCTGVRVRGFVQY
ncbi:hypothetical protein PC116_g8828 [Phytophthora cactorum]|uniref:Uncharacterized protein n=1 Tax=Phytophthora cactorum TaxID=29920 RepID=A0A329S9L3_9STRA|nr:hypothetical protein Pcac1_g27973 [Phytophthora cactorum]KAG3032483.1 hypothetical protein PC119_g5696 [Phytophthora cactorum]KAG4243268.1 hypothetical protein PC116_g8828 [Phytophthora cactorum]RAW33487.1 hypothetical protein PC110_g10183 [Phytophthora cactorum]